jgi:ribosomal protein L37AE/L43A
MMRDLFGSEITEAEARRIAAAGRKRREPTPAGYCASPGTGPKGETCGSCKHHVVKRLAKNYHKCNLARAAWTGGRKTDIRVRAPACLRWERAE